jgi:TPR repeat protein
MCDAITNRCADGNTDNMFTLGLMFATALDPPQLDEARTWLNRADQAGHAGDRPREGPR